MTDEPPATMKTARPDARLLGNMAEQAAARYFAYRGFQVMARNFSVPRLGELDLVLRQNEKLTFVEVKARSHADAFGGIRATITPAKLARLRRTASCFIKKNHIMNLDVTFLAAFVEINRTGQVVNVTTEPIEWI